MKKYIPSEVEAKWRRKWDKDKLYALDLDQAKKKFYLLVEFTYPSGDLHIGHWFAFAVPDVLGRLKRMQGYDVFYPNGFDAFGLPAENAAIQRGVHPKDWTLTNIENMKKQFSLMGAIANFENEVITCLQDYYKWNQWIFLKMLEKGIAYRGKALANWCPSCQTVLANENVEVGKCWRCGTEVVQKEVEQWFLKITEYADKLLWEHPTSSDIDKGVDWPIPVKVGQNNWIGKREGTVIKFRISNPRFKDEDIEVFTTRGDTLYGATFLVLAPEHPVTSMLLDSEEIKKYVEEAKKKVQIERMAEDQEKTGVFSGVNAINPINGEEIPVWIADYALMGFGTGALFGDAHDERDVVFAKKYKIPLKPTLITEDKEKNKRILSLEECFTGDGILVDSGQFTGLSSKEAREKIAEWLEEKGKGGRTTTYHLHDWSISRQRYWGTPIPIINCPSCGVVPVPEKDLPVELPYEGVDWAPKGKPPLATSEDWINVKCPKCGGEAKREAETMDTFVDSSWYFLRYLDHKNDKQIAGKDRLDKWMPVDIYFGGAEHTLGHTLYSRFFVKFLKDIGVVDFEEYAQKRINHGVILGPDGRRMSKSHGNVINPDEQVKSYGADTIRLYLCFIGPYDIVAPWNPGSVHGVYHFLQRVWGLQEKLEERENLSDKDLKIMHKTIKKVTEDIEAIKFNTPVAALMEWLNHLSRKEKVSLHEYKTLLLLLAPFAPHITEELWEITGEKGSIHKQSFPSFDNKYLEEGEVTVVIQVNGKIRDILVIGNNTVNNRDVIENTAKQREKVAKFLEGKSVKKVIHVVGRIVNFVV